MKWRMKHGFSAVKQMSLAFATFAMILAAGCESLPSAGGSSQPSIPGPQVAPKCEEVQDQVLAEKRSYLLELDRRIGALAAGIDALALEMHKSETGQGSVLGTDLLESAERSLPEAKRHRSALVDIHEGCLTDLSRDPLKCRVAIPAERSIMTEFWMLVNLLNSR